MSTTPAPAAAEPLSESARILNTFVAPSKTFTDLKRSASWWVPFVLITIVSYALIAVVAQKVGFEQVTRNAVRLTPRRAAQLEKLPPEQQQRQMALATSITKGISYAIPVVTLLYFLVIAVALMASFNFGAGAELKFGTSLAVVIYASLPGVLRGLLAIVSLIAGINPESFNFQNPVATNLGFLIDPTTSPALYTLGSSLDIFTLWTLALMALGFACVSKLKRGTTFAVVFGWWLLIVLIRTGWAAAFS